MDLDDLTEFNLVSIILGSLLLTLISSIFGLIQRGNSSLFADIILFTVIFFINFNLVSHLLIPIFLKLSEKSSSLMVPYIIIASPFLVFFGFTYYLTSKIESLTFSNTESSS